LTTVTDGNIEKHEFASPGWLALVRSITTDQVAGNAADLIGAKFGICEVYTDVPTRLDQSGRVAWHFYLLDDHLDWALGEVDDVDFKVVAPWSVIQPLARLVVAGDKAVRRDMNAAMEQAVQAGLAAIKGSSANGPRALAPLHDLIAGRTA
jgi:hypothetical protein